MAKQIAEMVIEKAIMELPDTKTIRLKWPDGYDLEFKTGQFITLYWPDTTAYKRDGKMGTRIVDWAKEGDKMWVIPPTGRFLPVYEPNKHLICIAGGSGVTPFRGFVREATRRQLDTKITILYSVRTTNDIIFNAEFKQLEQDNPNFNFYVTCTRLLPEDAWAGRRSRISAEWVRQHIHDLPNTVFYACGPNQLVENTETLVLEDLKVSKEQIKTEKWG